MPILHILHTNDLHDKLTPQKATFLKGLRRHFAPNVLLLDAGDAVRAGNLGAKHTEPILRLMDDCGYDAMAMGNRESHPTARALYKKLKDAKVPVLAANLRAKDDVRAPRIVQEYLEFEVGRTLLSAHESTVGRTGVSAPPTNPTLLSAPPTDESHDGRTIVSALPDEDDEDEEEDDESPTVITVLGLAPQITAPDSWWAKVTDYIFDDPLKTGPGLARKLRPDCHLLIALTHIGYERDVILCESPDIDLVLGGHSHRAVYPPEQHGHAWLAATDAHAAHVGHLTITFDEGGKGITEIVGEMIPLPGPGRRV
jgi:2',3'-cyclic-nucleotide 2'-phosphodiesterase (5'-nucleotidase family)